MNRLKQLQAFLAETPQDPFLHYAVALEHLKLGEEQKALAIFKQLTQTSPKYVGTYYHLGKLQEELKQQEAALTTYEQGMTVAQEVGDRHSYNELQQVYTFLQDELEGW